MQIRYKKQFHKRFKHLQSKQRVKVLAVLDIFKDDPFSPMLRNHALKGKYLGFRSIDVTGDIRIIFEELSDGTYELIELVTLGSHSQLY